MEPLLAIADEAGGDWPEAIRKAAVATFHSQAAEDQNIGVQLLADIRVIFEATTEDKITSGDLIDKLKEIETSPWADWSKGKGLSPNGLARLLKPFDVAPRTIRFEEKPAKGYLRESFKDALARYLPSPPSLPGFAAVTPLQPAYSLIETDFSGRDKNPSVTVAKSASDPHEHCVVTAVTVQKSLREGVDGKEPSGPSRAAQPVDPMPSIPVPAHRPALRAHQGTRGWCNDPG